MSALVNDGSYEIPDVFLKPGVDGVECCMAKMRIHGAFEGTSHDQTWYLMAF